MSTLAAWLLTYLLHSTLLLGGALGLRLVLGERRLAVQEAVIRAALVGGFLTASLQLGLGLQPMGGVFSVSEPLSATATRAGVAAEGTEMVSGSLPDVVAEMRTGPVETAVAKGWELPPAHVWRPAVMGLWLAIALLGLGRLVVAALRLRRMLSSRQPIVVKQLASRAAALAAGLGLRRRVPLSTAPRLDVPLATGVLRPEVCLPPRALAELEEDQQVALCAHELAHVARRDPAWILVARLAEAVTPMQPLNRWARRRLQDVAECLSDDLAVAASGRPERLARSLVDVASWTVADAVPFPAVAAGALSSRSRLGHRVERLMDPLRALERPGRLLLPLAAIIVLATAFVTPVVSGSTAETEPATAPRAPEPTVAPEPPLPPEPPAAPRAPQAPEAPEAPEAPDAPAESAAERELEELTERIGQRAEAQAAELKEVSAEIERVVEANMPPPEDMERFEKEIEDAAEVVAQAHLAEKQGGEAPSEEELAEAKARMKAASKKLREATGHFQIPEAELQRLTERARELAEAAAPTAEEQRRLKELTREIVEESMPDLEALKGEMKEISRTINRETMDSIRESMRGMQETLRQTMRDMPRVSEQVREARRAARDVEREVARTSREAARAAARESRREGERGRTLEEAEESHLEGTGEAPPESPES